ncbi:MAG: phosphonate C-P lyase system protein PhnL [Deltaproteobacteria bacterium]|jgi:alpha-D-ribose 1-methylphosphonate 5-triphosphate synthase subunit PhnL|nr:phosphonate C-P lyase system protein PhnL [Deltaproteobacteria bacterium]
MLKNAIITENLKKSFTLHHQGPAHITALVDVNLLVPFGSCLSVNGPSGCGKSTLLRCLYGNYRICEGSLKVAHQGAYLDLAQASEREILDMRKHSVSYVSQFLRVIPRVPAVEIVAAPLISQGKPRKESLERAKEALITLSVPERLWSLPPLTFSGGEKQRVNIARGLIKESPVLLLDEPTASLDRKNREKVANLIIDAKKRGTAVVGVFHDREIRDMVSDSVLELAPLDLGRGTLDEDELTESELRATGVR